MRHASMFAAAFAILAGTQPARAEVLLTVRSDAPVAETLDRLQRVATGAGFFVAARVDHAKGAASVGMALRPTELLVFGNPRGGTPLMLCDQRVGIDLPLRALAWEDAGGQVWLGMTDPAVLKARHGLGPECDAPIAAVTAATRRLLDAASKPVPNP